MKTQWCESCQKSWPIEHFPEIGDRTTCEFCLLGEDAKKAEDRIVEKTKELTDKLLDATTGDSIAIPKVKDVLGAIYREMGGPDGFAQKFVWVLSQLMARKTVPASAGSLMLSLAKIHQVVEANDDSNNISKMTDEQIRREQELAFMQMLLEASKNPDSVRLITQALSANGMKVVDMGIKETIDSIHAQAEAL